MEISRKCHLELPPFFSDGMILQRNKPLKFWGWDKPQTDVVIHFNNQRFESLTENNGEWEILIDSQSAGGPYEIRIEGTTSQTIRDVYVGEVWLAGGQSNMELPINRVRPFHPEEIDEMNFPLVRQFQVTQTQNFHGPVEKTEGGKWIKAIPSEIDAFSGVGYFFARELYRELDVPIGIYLTAVGGTPAEAWMSKETLDKIEDYNDAISYLKDDKKINQDIEDNTKEIEAWYQLLHQTDQGKSEEIPWNSFDYNDDDWKSITLPKMFRDTKLDGLSGVVWLRKEIYLDEKTIADPELRIWLGTLIDADDTYVNGVHVGRTDYRYPPRIYPVDNNILQVGKNIITVRLEITNSLGGFIPGREYALKGETTNIPLGGEWQYNVSTVMDKPLPNQLTLHNKPIGLYNSILYPLKKLAIQGTIFYQGESNGGKPGNYDLLMEGLIKDWRELWGEDMYFLFVQLANYFEPTATIDDRNWAIIRDKQDKVSQKLENVGLVSAVDVGEDSELHPPEKMTLGKRLANATLNNIYGISRKYEHHRIQSVKETAEYYQLNFEPSVQSLFVKNGEMPDIEIQEGSGEWITAESEVYNTHVKVLKKSNVSDQAIRYAWRNAPKGILVDRESQLPVLPFVQKLNEKKVGK